MQVSHMPLVYFAPVLALKAVTVGKENGGDGWGYIQRSHYSFMHAAFISTTTKKLSEIYSSKPKEHYTLLSSYSYFPFV